MIYVFLIETEGGFSAIFINIRKPLASDLQGRRLRFANISKITALIPICFRHFLQILNFILQNFSVAITIIINHANGLRLMKGYDSCLR